MKEWAKRLIKAFNADSDLTTGNLYLKMLAFTTPIVLLSLLQLLYTSADLLVVNYFGGGYTSFIAVSSNGSLVNLVIGLFVGISVGANVVVAKAKGSNDKAKAELYIKNSLLLSLILGFSGGIVGYFIAPQLLVLMNTPSDVLPLATTYLRYYFIGLPFLMIFNFASAILRALGDSKKPLYALIFCGAANIGMNFLFVITFKMDVAGVALATILSEFLEAFLTIIFLLRKKDGFVSLKLTHLLGWNTPEMIEILRHGVPAGLQSFVFSVSNVFIQGSVNSFGAAAMAGNSAASQAEGYLYVIQNGFSVAVVAMVAQNYGAGNTKNIKKILWYSLLTVTGIGLTIGGIFSLCKEGMISIFINERAVSDSQEYQTALTYGENRLVIICMTYFACGLMDSEAAYCRGLGHPMAPTLVTLFGCCILRLVFILGIFPYVPFFHTLEWIWASWPISWVVSDLLYIPLIPKYLKQANAEVETKKQKIGVPLPNKN